MMTMSENKKNPMDTNIICDTPLQQVLQTIHIHQQSQLSQKRGRKKDTNEDLGNTEFISNGTQENMYVETNNTLDTLTQELIGRLKRWSDGSDDADTRISSKIIQSKTSLNDSTVKEFNNSDVTNDEHSLTSSSLGTKNSITDLKMTFLHWWTFKAAEIVRYNLNIFLNLYEQPSNIQNEVLVELVEDLMDLMIWLGVHPSQPNFNRDSIILLLDTVAQDFYQILQLSNLCSTEHPIQVVLQDSTQSEISLRSMRPEIQSSILRQVVLPTASISSVRQSGRWTNPHFAAWLLSSSSSSNSFESTIKPLFSVDNGKYDQSTLNSFQSTCASQLLTLEEGILFILGVISVVVDIFAELWGRVNVIINVIGKYTQSELLGEVRALASIPSTSSTEGSKSELFPLPLLSPQSSYQSMSQIHNTSVQRNIRRLFVEMERLVSLSSLPQDMHVSATLTLERIKCVKSQWQHLFDESPSTKDINACLDDCDSISRADTDDTVTIHPSDNSESPRFSTPPFLFSLVEPKVEISSSGSATEISTFTNVERNTDSKRERTNDTGNSEHETVQLQLKKRRCLEVFPGAITNSSLEKTTSHLTVNNKTCACTTNSLTNPSLATHQQPEPKSAILEQLLLHHTQEQQLVNILQEAVEYKKQASTLTLRPFCQNLLSMVSTSHNLEVCNSASDNQFVPFSSDTDDSDSDNNQTAPSVGKRKRIREDGPLREVTSVRYDEKFKRWRCQWFDADGQRHRKSFGVKKYGNDEAKRRCLAFKRDIELAGEAAKQHHTEDPRLQSQVKGVAFDTANRWYASWYENRKERRIYFSVKEYGSERAKKLAHIARREAERTGKLPSREIVLALSENGSNSPL